MKDFDYNISCLEKGNEENVENKKNSSRAHKRSTKNIYKKEYSEVSLMDILPHDLKNGYSYHCLSNGDIDSLSYLKYILRQQDLDYLLFSTWCMASADIIELQEWIEQGKIKRLDAYEIGRAHV